MKLLFIVLFGWIILSTDSFAQVKNPLDTVIPIRGLCIGQPSSQELKPFLTFIEKELVPRKINTLILRVDYAFQYTSHPELRDSLTLSKAEVKQIVHLCQKLGINLIPEIDLLGHQSWARDINPLLRKHPEFDETPWVKNPDVYIWPNSDNLYCRSYCPLYPGLHAILFDLIDEICDVYEAHDFHGGMDEVFYLGEDQCPRCSGMDKAQLFADEVRRIDDHLASKNRHLWIWGDRLLDGKTNGLGSWEASFNNTYRAVDLMPKDVMICDWHYEKAEKTAVYLAMKGFNVTTCTWRIPSISVQQVKDMKHFRLDSSPALESRYQGIIQTIWSPVDVFLKEYYGETPVTNPNLSEACLF